MMSKTQINNVAIDHIKCVILGGNLDFGRCPLASRYPLALWPMGDRPVIEHLLCGLQEQGLRQVTICANGQADLFRKSISAPTLMDIVYVDEPLPLGTAGCIRAAATEKPETLYLVLNATMVAPPNVRSILCAHHKYHASMTMILPSKSVNGVVSSQGYLCDASVIDYIPEQGYFDIKEGLIPRMVRDNKTICTHSVKKMLSTFRDRVEYLHAVSVYLHRQTECNGQEHPLVRIHPTAEVSPDCKLIGPIQIMEGAKIGKGTIIFGPSVIGRNVTIERNSFLSNSVLWDKCHIGESCEISHSIVSCNTHVYRKRVVENLSMVGSESSIWNSMEKKYTTFLNIMKLAQSQIMKYPASERMIVYVQRFITVTNKQKQVFSWSFFVSLLVAVLIWSYLPELRDLWAIWQKSDEYSGGMIVPFLAIYLIWARRQQFRGMPIQGSLWGIVFLIVAQGVRYFGLMFMYSSAERLSLVLTIASLVLFLSGWSVFRRALPILLFLLLMLPFPKSVHTAIMLPLQNLATKTAVFFLELFGYAVMREGNVIHINDTYVAVAEACNGLRMITSFFIIISMVALLIQRSVWEKLILVITGVPIALLCNSFRLTLTTMAFTFLDMEKWELFFHDFGGYAMMPVALVIVVVELWLLKKVLITSETIEQPDRLKKVNRRKIGNNHGKFNEKLFKTNPVK